MSTEKKAEIAQKVEIAIERYLGMESLKKVLVEMGITRGQFVDCVDGNTLLAARYDRARQFRADEMAEDITEIADTETDSMKARNMIDARKWYASKMQPQRYGDRLDITLNQTVDIGSALREARNRALPQRDLEIEAKPQMLDSIGIQAIDATGSKPVSDAESKVPVDNGSASPSPDPRGIAKGG